uniref:Uncharacterized protein n=1 Tax=Chromera velia CCMP2878 TaxID=1169474 RepID=A0A0G4HPR5_9ALVE|eukprot:Cvel_7845.t1-p1 / transcript=Cvel_7845.t1 / gene=Cvel_7845 / organism=Chromera_velia_CCMP2878 / gene_product=hypothetical protein / transcript_product=hypothetical protein / location=Cvel_scaffold419:84127-85550(+) / protein_length=159 / sequence_SO=supercontig / SO=protein_coding / is_pseudo=false
MGCAASTPVNHAGGLTEREREKQALKRELMAELTQDVRGAIDRLEKDFARRCAEISQNPPPLVQVDDRRHFLQPDQIQRATKRGFVVLSGESSSGSTGCYVTVLHGPSPDAMKESLHQVGLKKGSSVCVPIYMGEYFVVKCGWSGQPPWSLTAEFVEFS